MTTQNNPEQPSGLLWVIFVEKTNPEQPRRTQKFKTANFRDIFEGFLKSVIPVGYCGLFLWKKRTQNNPEEPSGLFWDAKVKKEKKKEPKKKINKIPGCWNKDFGLRI